MLRVRLLGLASLPVIPPVADQELEAESVDFHAWLEANAQISEIQFVLLGVSEKEGQVASYGEEEIVVEWREIGELIDKHLRDALGAGALSIYAILRLFGEKLIREFAEPGFEHRADYVDIVEVVLLKEIDVKF